MLLPAVQLMKLQLHGPLFLCARILEQARSGIAPTRRELCPEAFHHQPHTPRTGIARPQQDSAEYPNEISALDAELGLRDIPGKLVQWRTQPQRFRCSVLLASIQNPSR